MIYKGFIVLTLALAACHPKDSATSESHAVCDKAFAYDFKNDITYDGYSACSDSQYPQFVGAQARWTGHYPEHCEGVSGEDAFACGEQLFWQALQIDTGHRLDIYYDLKQLTEETEARGDLDAFRLGHMHWRLGQLGVAIFAEQGDLTPAVDLDEQFTRAYELVPNKVLIEAWMRTTRLNASIILGADVQKAIDELMETYEKDRILVGGVVMGATAGFAKNTGWPAFSLHVVESIDKASCGGELCGKSVNRAPYTFSGTFYAYAEVYARMGYREETEHWLKESLLAKNADTWPYRKNAEAALQDMDGFIGKFTALGDDQPVSDLMITARSAACMICHSPLP